MSIEDVNAAFDEEYKKHKSDPQPVDCMTVWGADEATLSMMNFRNLELQKANRKLQAKLAVANNDASMFLRQRDEEGIRNGITIARLEADRNELTLRCQKLVDEVQKLVDEVSAYKSDAKRYRLLRAGKHGNFEVSVYSNDGRGIGNPDPVLLDAMIDVALEKKK